MRLYLSWNLKDCWKDLAPLTDTFGYIWIAAALADKLPFWLLPIFLFCQSITDFEVLKVLLHLSTVIHSYADFIN